MLYAGVLTLVLEDRVKHGALTDCKLLSEVYIELLGGRQEKLLFSQKRKLKIIYQISELKSWNMI